MRLQQELQSSFQKEHAVDLFPIIEIQLEGNILFSYLIDVLYLHYKIPYRLIKADIEYLDKGNFGTLLIQLQGTQDKNNDAIDYLNQNNIKNSIKNYKLK